MKKVLFTLAMFFFVVFVSGQNLMEEQVLSKPSKPFVIKWDTTYYEFSPIKYADKCAPNTTFGKSGFYTYLTTPMKKVLSAGLSEMGVDTLNCEIIIDDSYFHTLNKDEYSAYYVNTTLKNGEYVQNIRIQDKPYYRPQKTIPTEKKPKVFIDYFCDETDSQHMSVRIFVER